MSEQKSCEIVDKLIELASQNSGTPLMAVSLNGKRVKIPRVDGWVFEYENATTGDLLSLARAFVTNGVLSGEYAAQMVLALGHELEWDVKVSQPKQLDGGYFCQAGIVGGVREGLVYITIPPVQEESAG